MFNMVYKSFDENKKIYSFRGYFGMSFYKALTKLSTKKKIDLLFIKVGTSSIEIYSFFLLELVELINVLEAKGSVYNVNIGSLINIREYIVNEVWGIDNHFNLNYDAIENKMTYKILDQQKAAFTGYLEIRKKFNYRGFLLDSYVGSGKTFMSVALAEAVNSNKIVIFCPLPTIDRVWSKSISEEFYKSSVSHWVSTKGLPYEDERIIIAHYDYLPKFKDIVKYIKGRDTTIIIDESHNFNEIKSKRSKLLLSYLSEIGSDNVILLTGTPVKAVATELIPMLKMLDKDFTPVIEKRFSKIYKSPDSFFKNTLPMRYKNYSVKIIKKEDNSVKLETKYISVKLKNYKEYTMSHIAEMLKAYISNRKEELERDFKTYEDNYNYLYTKYKNMLIGRTISYKDFDNYESDFRDVIKAYKTKSLMFYPDLVKRVNQFENELMKHMEQLEKKQFKEAKTIVKYVYLKIQGEALANVILKQRIKCHVDMANAFNYKSVIESTTKKTLVFSNYIDVCVSAKSACESNGYKTLNVYGNDAKNLSNIVKEFSVNEKMNPLITTFKSLSTGVPLIMANVMVVIDLPFRSYIYEQAVGRIRRLGQDKDVFVYIAELDANGEATINSRNIDIITFFKQEVENITGYEVDVNLDGRNNGANISNEDYYDILNSTEGIAGLYYNRLDENIEKILNW